MERWLIVLCAMLLLWWSPGSAQAQNNTIQNAYIVFTTDPMDVASDLVQHFRSRGITARTFDRATFSQRQPPRTAVGASRGTGFFVDDSGTIVTNYHVIEGRESIIVSLPDGNRLPATVLSTSPALDVAVLSIQGYQGRSFINLSSSSASPSGQRIFALGYPLSDVLGTEARVTDGVVSSLSGLGNDASLMQMTAAIQPGNSGGPIILENGDAVGIAVARLDDAYAIQRYGAVPQNVNFAIKIDFARPLVAQFLRVSDPARRATSLESALAATVLLEASPAAASLSSGGVAPVSGDVVVTFSYQTFFDGFSDQLGNLEISVSDMATGEIVGRFAWSGMTVSGKRNVVARALRDLDQDLGLTPPQ